MLLELGRFLSCALQLDKEDEAVRQQADPVRNASVELGRIFQGHSASGLYLSDQSGLECLFAFFRFHANLYFGCSAAWRCLDPIFYTSLSILRKPRAFFLMGGMGLKNLSTFASIWAFRVPPPFSQLHILRDAFFWQLPFLLRALSSASFPWVDKVPVPIQALHPLTGCLFVFYWQGSTVCCFCCMTCLFLFI